MRRKHYELHGLAVHPDNFSGIGNEYAKFNNCPHLCLDLPNSLATISVRTARGKRMTFGFHPLPSYDICDIQYHDSGKTTRNGDRDVPVIPFSIWTPGHPIIHDGTIDPESAAGRTIREIVATGQVPPCTQVTIQLRNLT